ncbi:MAG: pirin-like C-terminal cupin domain-containing protein, partial [Flavobacterium sp.]
KGTEIEIEAITDTVILVLSGEPTNEPIVAGGPFVMNNKAEIDQAFKDYNLGCFGYLED